MSNKDRRILNPRSTAAVIIGAHDWTRAGLGRSPAFRRSASRIVAYLYDKSGMNLDPELVINLFDDTSSAGDQLVKIKNTLGLYLEERQESNNPVTDLIVYYIGHGHPDDVGSLSLLVRSTEQNSEVETGIRTPDLARTLLRAAPQQRRSIILDCCFSESAAKSFIGMSSDVNQQVASMTLHDLSDYSASRGTLILCSSPIGRVSYAKQSDDYTLFTGSLLDILQNGIDKRSEYISFSEIRDATFVKMLSNFGANAPRPVLHQANAAEGDLTRAPAFPNRLEILRRQEAERAEERERWAAEEQRRQEAARAEEREQLAVEEQRRQEATRAEERERLAAEEQRRQEATRAEERERLAAEEQRRQEATRAEERERLAAEEQRRQEATRAEERERLAAEEQRQQEATRAEERERLAVEEQRQQEATRAEERERLAVEEQRQQEAARAEERERLAVEEQRQQEAARAEERERLAVEEQRRAKRREANEAARRAVEEVKAREKAQLESQLFQRSEQQRRNAEQARRDVLAREISEDVRRRMEEREKATKSQPVILYEDNTEKSSPRLPYNSNTEHKISDLPHISSKNIGNKPKFEPDKAKHSHASNQSPGETAIGLHQNPSLELLIDNKFDDDRFLSFKNAYLQLLIAAITVLSIYLYIQNSTIRPNLMGEYVCNYYQGSNNTIHGTIFVSNLVDLNELNMRVDFKLTDGDRDAILSSTLIRPTSDNFSSSKTPLAFSIDAGSIGQFVKSISTNLYYKGSRYQVKCNAV